MKNKKINKPKVKEVSYKGKFTVVKFTDRDHKSFECIPDIWFVDENKEACFWPPKTGKSVTLRAISGDMPDDSWLIYGCEIISENHPTYSEGSKIVREKVAQKYNTSSADDELQAAMFRRKHPGLVAYSKSFDCVFKKDSQPVNEVGEKQQTTDPINETANCENHGHKERNEEMFDRTQAIVSEDLQENGKNTANENRSKEKFTLSTTESAGHLIRSRSVESRSSYTPRSIHRINRSRSRSGQSQSSDTTRRSNRSRSRSGQSDSSKTSRSTSRSRSIQSRSSSTRKSSTAGSNRSRSKSSQQSCKTSSSQSTTPPTNRHEQNKLILKADRENRSKNWNPNNRSTTLKSKDEVSESNTIVKGQLVKSDTNRKDLNLPNSNSEKRPKPISKNESIATSSTSITQRASCHSSSRSRSRSSHRSSSRNRCHSASQFAARSVYGSSLVNCDIRQARNFQANTAISLPVNQQQHTHQDSNHSSRSRSIRSNVVNLTGQDLVTEVKELKKAVRKVSEHLTAIDRRFDRLEVTVNKTFILVGDATRRPYQPEDPNVDNENDENFDVPSIPIRNTKKLAIFQRKLKNREFRDFLINREKEFCGPSGRQTDTVVMTKYLQRFISLRVRSKLTLKEKGDSGITLFDDYNNVYPFLIDLIKAGYKARNKTIITDEAHQALRIVWGRSKQLEKEQQTKLANKERKKNLKNRRLR